VIVETLRQTAGKVPSETLLGEVYPVLDLLKFYQAKAAAILAPRGVITSPLAFPGSTARIEHRPYGVVAVISPWNYPFQLSLAPLIGALIAGNGVLLKVSELSSPVADLIGSLLEKAGIPAGLVQLIHGEGDTGAALIDARPDLVLFTGSVATGRAIMARAARHPIPVILELGGKDPMIVFDDAPFERAVRGAVYGAFSNAGQVCVSVERCYVQQGLYRRFVDAVVAAAAELKPGSDLGPMVSERQLAIIEDHYRDAIERGAQASGPLRRDGNALRPVVLWDVDHSMKLMREETFGPLLPIMPFADENQAVDLANDSDLGLNASVWSLDLAKAERVARRLRVGGWAVNEVIKNIGHAGLPFGGVRNSGCGRYRGAEGLLAFTQPVAGLTNLGRMPREPNWFPYSEDGYRDLRGFVDFVFGEGAPLERIRRNWPALQAFRQYSALDLVQRWENLKLTMPWKRGY
ncbi:MAG: aldehyde dehydrogenase family protein, partial [Methylococcaceae bacterium]|nr:aldehyde dehydrogenase family protein [Methylococcaceae bacterium]